MKQIKNILIAMILLLSVSAISQPQLTWRFANPQLINGDTQLQFDVDVMSDVAGWYIYIAQLGFTYNEAAFGPSIYLNGNVTVETGALLNELYLGALGKYSIISTGDPFSNTLGATAQTSLESFFVSSAGDSHTEWPTAWTQAFIVTIDIANPAEAYNIDWWYNGMDGQQSCQTGFPLTVELCANPNFYELWPSAGTDWIGDVSDDWNDPANWTNGVPEADDDVNIDATITKATYAPTIYGSAVTGALNLVAGTLSIAPGGDLTTTGMFTNDGALYMSNALGVSASYMDLGGLAGVGTFTYDRDVFASGSNPLDPADPMGWHYLGAPIDGLSTDNLLDYYVNQWDEVGGMWMNYAGTSPCIAYSPAETLDALEAWSVNYDSQWPSYGCTGGTGNVVEYTGLFTALHTGGYSAPATVTTGAYSGWNAYGNPYASAIDPATFNWAGYENTLYGLATYDGAAGNYIYSNLGNGYAYNVGPTQGFFVQALAPATFSLTGAERVHDNGTTIYKDAVSNLLILEATGNGTSDLAYIRFMEDMDAGMDVADFPKLFSTTEGLAQIYTTAAEEMLAVNALPATSIVPMGFTSVTTGEYTISAIETSDFANVVLEDLVTGEQTDLLTSSYTFNYTKNDAENRFLVHFTPLGIGNNAAASINIWSNDHKIYVQAPEIAGDIVVFNMMGQEVVRTDIEPGLNTILVNDRNTYYVVKVVSSDVAKTGKVYVK